MIVAADEGEARTQFEHEIFQVPQQSFVQVAPDGGVVCG